MHLRVANHGALEISKINVTRNNSPVLGKQDGETTQMITNKKKTSYIPVVGKKITYAKTFMSPFIKKLPAIL